MRTVWKFERNETPDAAFAVALPEGATVLQGTVRHAGGGKFRTTLWALVDSDAAPQERVFQVFGTGHELPTAPIGHVATCRDGPFVWHIFEVFETDVPADLDPERHADFRYLLEAGYTLGEPVGDPEQPDTPKLRPWVKPNDEPVMDPLIYAAVANLQEHGYGPVVGASK